LKINSKGIEAFGPGIHSIQDAFAHEGAVFSLKPWINEHSLHNDSNPNKAGFTNALYMTSSAISVHQIMSSDLSNIVSGMEIGTKGMSANQLKKITEKLGANGFDFIKSEIQAGNDEYTVTKKKN
jgi:hypothetical protein